MRLEIDTVDQKQKILLVAKKKSFFIDKLKSHLEKLGGEVYYSPHRPKSWLLFDICFFVNELDYQRLLKKPPKKLVLIYLNQESLAVHIANQQPKYTKIISINGDLITENDIDKILWFAFSRSREKIIKLLVKKDLDRTTPVFLRPIYNLKRFFKPKSLILLIIGFFLILETFFFFPLLITSYFSYLGYLDIKKENLHRLADRVAKQKLFLQLTKKFYALAKPVWLFFSLANFPNDLIVTNEQAGLLMEKFIAGQTTGREIVNLFLKKNKTVDDYQLFSLRINRLKTDLEEMGDSLTIINNKLPSNINQLNHLKKSIVRFLEIIGQIKKIFPYLNEILAKDGEKTYLLLFTNNMELRPGGGFIGSFGVLKISRLTLEEIKVYDVYDADGQLKAHIEPPPPIKNYLHQPHWFLRDSAFSPDFYENYLQAKFFLEKELAMKNFDGGILITTSAIENLLTSFDNLYLPDFKEKINSKNFYLKAQYYSEKNFFPGSLQKKSFLSSLLQQTLINIDLASPSKLISAVKKSLDEKQLVIYFENQPLQKNFDLFFWSGRLIKPRCLEEKENCLIDFLMPIDANLGVNKANFFINRIITFKTYFTNSGKVNHLFSITFKNESPADVFPGGSYKNYFQVYLPKDIVVKSITQNGISIDENLLTDEIKDDWYRVLGMLIEVKPKSSTEIKINYQLKNYFPKGRLIYQLVVQKQIGSANNDFVFEIYLDKGYSLISQNFIPLVKDNQILYNTYLTTDKIFLIEMIKE